MLCACYSFFLVSCLTVFCLVRASLLSLLFSLSAWELLLGFSVWAVCSFQLLGFGSVSRCARSVTAAHYCGYEAVYLEALCLGCVVNQWPGFDRETFVDFATVYCDVGESKISWSEPRFYSNASYIVLFLVSWFWVICRHKAASTS